MELYPKADILKRSIARFIDFLIIGAFSNLLPPIGFYAGMTYLLIADGLFNGRSIGKRIIGLQTILTERIEGCGFKESIIRNSPFALAYILFCIKYIGWIFTFIIIGFELLLIIGNERGIRFGDEMAKTQVLDGEKIDINLLERRDKWV
ncbi:MAG: RDD family protein [Nitrospirota bacterium]